MGGSSPKPPPAPTYTSRDGQTFEDPNKAADRDRQIALAVNYGFTPQNDNLDAWTAHLKNNSPDQYASYSDYNNQGLTAADYRSEQRIKEQQDQAAAAERQRQANIAAARSAIDSGFNGFDDNYYSGISKSVLDYYTPQLEDQFGNANKQLTYDLARKGQLKSTSAGERQNELKSKYDLQRGDITTRASDAERQARENVSSTKARLYNLAESTADPAAVNTQLASENARLKAYAPELSPLGQVFGDYVTPAINTIGNGLIAESQGNRGFNTGLFDSKNKGSAKVVGY
jgi:hypothetical protein